MINLIDIIFPDCWQTKSLKAVFLSEIEGEKCYNPEFVLKIRVKKPRTIDNTMIKGIFNAFYSVVHQPLA